MRKKSNTVRYSAEQVKRKIGRGEDRTDWQKASGLVGKKLEMSILADADDVHAEPNWLAAVRGIPMPKDHINIRVDHDILVWFKSRGRGYQTLMNNVLRAFVESRQPRKARRAG